MKKVVRLTERDLVRLVKRVISEQPLNTSGPRNYTEQIEEIFQGCDDGSDEIGYRFVDFSQDCPSCIELYSKVIEESQNMGVSAKETLLDNFDLSDSCSDELMEFFNEESDDLTVSSDFFICMNKKLISMLQK